MDFGLNIFEWIQQQLIYLGWTVIGVLVLFAVFKKASSSLIGIIVLGAIGLAIISNPGDLGDLGQSLWRRIFG